MRVGIPNAGQLNALETLNIRGERSVTCKAKCDAHPSDGPLPAACPAACEEFRKQPDALERAAELDAQYGTNPDLEKLPMYCVAFSLEELVRREGHALDRRQRRELRDGCAEGWIRPTSPICARRARSVFAVATAARRRAVGVDGPAEAEVVLPDGNLAYARLGRPALQSVRHRARAARHEHRLRRVRRRESGGLLDLRTELGVVQGPGVAQQRRQPADDQRHHDGRRHG